jgi:hypothetical protein
VSKDRQKNEVERAERMNRTHVEKGPLCSLIYSCFHSTSPSLEKPCTVGRACCNPNEYTVYKVLVLFLLQKKHNFPRSLEAIIMYKVHQDTLGVV